MINNSNNNYINYNSNKNNLFSRNKSSNKYKILQLSKDILL